MYYVGTWILRERVWGLMVRETESARGTERGREGERARGREGAS